MASKNEQSEGSNSENKSYPYIVALVGLEGLAVGAICGLALGCIQEASLGSPFNISEIVNVLWYGVFGAAAGGASFTLGASGALIHLQNPDRKK